MRLSILSILFFSLCISNSNAQSYIWNNYSSGNYLVDYEANQKKIISPNKNFSAADFEIDTVAQKIMVLANDGIQVLNLDGSFDRFIPIDYYGEERDLEIDQIRRILYFIMGDKILKMNYDGSGLTVLYDDDAAYINDLGIDPYRNKMYWLTGGDPEIIKQANLDGTNVISKFTGPDMRDMQYDANENSVYFRNISDDKIERINFDDNSRTTIYSYPSSTGYVSDMEVDVKNKILYFQTSTPFQFFQLDLTTGIQKTLYKICDRVNNIKPFDQNVFLNVDSYSGDRIVNLDLNTDELTELTKRQDYLTQFAVDEINQRWIGTTVYSQIQTTDMFGNVVHQHRPRGMNNLHDIQIVNDRIIYLDNRNLYSTNLQFGDLSLLTTLEELSPMSITHNPNDNKIYIVSRWRGNIYSCNLDGSEYGKFMELDSILSREFPFTDIVFSEYNDKFYLAASEDSLLMQMDEDGTNLITLESGDFNDDLTYLSLDPTGQYLYYRSANSGIIYQMDVVTKEKIVYASNIPSSISELFFHPTDGFLYGVNSSDELIYKFENGGASVVYQEGPNIDLRNGLAIDDTGAFYVGLSQDYKAIRKINPSLTSSSSHLDRNYYFGRRVRYDSAENELWGTVRPQAAGSMSKPFKLDLDTDEMSYYPEIGYNFETIIIPKHKMIYWIDDTDDRFIVRNNLTTGSIDTILYINENFKRYTNMIYNPVNERLYYGRADDDLRLQSTDVFGNDHRIENYNYPMSTMVAVNAADTTITILENYGDDKINRWNFVTGKFVSYGEEQDEAYKRSWNLVGSYYENIDEDGDGFSFIEDCNDGDSSVNPGAVEIPDNNIDENCDGVLAFTDEDGDGITLEFDCNDQDSLINIYALEIPNNNIDENCDGIIEIIDEDGDGFNSDEDCDDNNPDVNPNAQEIANNYIDEDCDGVLAGTDEDGDGFFITDDCDDNNPDVNPNAQEIDYNGLDDDCNTNTPDDDLDGDGFVLADDCDDNNSNINPSVLEVPYNGIDDDCDSLTFDDDLDQDGYLLVDDCDDNNSDINPGQNEVPYNALDDDCDTNTPDDDLDGDGFVLADDCDDNNSEVNPDQLEILGNGIDDDCDGVIDETSGVHQLGATSIRIFPNPTHQFIHIKTKQVIDLHVKLYSSKGVLVFAKDRVSKIDVSNLTPGTYLINLTNISDRSQLVEKIIILD